MLQKIWSRDHVPGSAVLIWAWSAQSREDAELGQHPESIGCASKLGHPAISDS